MPDADRALRAALLMCAGLATRAERVARIADTLDLHSRWVSDALLSEVEADPAMRVVECAEEFPTPALM